MLQAIECHLPHLSIALGFRDRVGVEVIPLGTPPPPSSRRVLPGGAPRRGLKNRYLTYLTRGDN